MEKTEDKNFLKIISTEDAKEFEQIAKGRKFCKKGERIVDIYDQEFKRYKIEQNNNLFNKIFKKRKIKKYSQKFELENRISCNIRSIIFKCLRNEENENKDKDEVISTAKKIILNTVKEYKEKNNK